MVLNSLKSIIIKSEADYGVDASFMYVAQFLLTYGRKET